MLPHCAHETTIASARPAHPAARERQQFARRLLREASLELARLRRIRGAYRRTARRVAGARRRLALAAGLLGVPLAGAAGALTPSFVSPFLIPTVGSLGSPAFADLDGDGALELELTRFRGPPHTWEGGVPDAEESFAVPAGAEAAAGREGEGRAQPRVARRGVRAVGPGDSQLGSAGRARRGATKRWADDGREE